MAFRMICPKCDTSDFSIERDRRAYAHGTESADLIFSCRCGKRLFGNQVVEEYERQKKAWAESSKSRQAEAVEKAREEVKRQERDEKMREALAHRAKVRDDKRKEDDARTEEESERWRNRAANDAESEDSDEGQAGAEDGECCAWVECANTRRSNSKYCSRECSNKNARARHRKRKTKPDEAEAA